MRRPLRLLSAALLCAGVAAPSAAAESLGTLLGRLEGPPAAASVKVLSWVERGEDGADELVVTLIPEGATKLVADPGVVVTPVARAGIAWTEPAPANWVEPGRDYFAAPPVLRLPFKGGDGKPVEAAVEYAYCVVERQCLFGEARVSAATEPRG